MAAVRHRLLLLFLFLFLFLCFINLASSVSNVESLLKFKKSFAKSPAALESWDAKSNDPCSDQWFGVVCFNDIVTGLRLQDMSLSGTIDVEALRGIPGLRTISLVNNNFSGPLPEFNKLGALKALFLSKNQFSGEIPNDFFSPMGSLKKLWLDRNKFTGKIPDSTMKLRNLIELHLENNQFSGSIPPLKQPTLVTSLDLSNNKLEGEIPESFSKFKANSFAKNDGLCGKQVEKDCKTAEAGDQAKSAGDNNHGGNKTGIGLGVVATLIFFIFIFVILAKRRDRDDFSVLGKEPLNHDQVVQVHVPRESSTTTKRTSSRKGGGDSQRLRSGSRRGKNGIGDLEMVNGEKGSFGLPDLMKAAAEVLGNGGLGSAYKAVMDNGLSVVVKRMREMNRLTREQFDVEMKRFGGLRHPNILTPLAYHYRREEKLVVSEYMPKGSLLYVLHGDRGICHSQLSWSTRMNIIKGIANGLGFLHSEFASYDLPHGNLKSSNVLLDENYEPQLSDYAFHPLINPNSAAQAMFAYKTPEYTQFQQVSHKSDVYCLGIIILETLTGKFPSQYLSNGKGGTDVVQWVHSSISEDRETELIDPEISNDANSLGMMVKLLQIGADCTESDVQQRPEMSEAVRKIEEIQV
ncbi:hypothetical protein QYF36_011760 [Acer negundo]|nr:hypothetical protein QYF36_011760 [Acer negundo]